MAILFSGKTDVGKKRSSNQDSIYLGGPERLFIVADGMGGHQGGDIASQLAIELFPKTFRQHIQRPVIELISEAFKVTNQGIYDYSLRDGKLKGMGTTLVGYHFRDQNLHLFNVGDSRCYLIHQGELFQLSKDHSLIQEKINLGIYNRLEAAQDKQKNILVRSVGFESKIDIDQYQFKVHRGDIFILCSDGLHGPVSDSQILSLVNRHLPPKTAPTQHTLDALASGLIDLANALGGPDNISVIISAAV